MKRLVALLLFFLAATNAYASPQTMGMWFASPGTAQTQNTSNFIALGSLGAQAANTYIIPVTGTIKNLRGAVGSALPAGSWSFTVFINGSSSGTPTCTISGTTCFDGSTTFSVNAGDEIAVQSVSSGSTGTLSPSASIEITPSNPANNAPIVAFSTSATVGVGNYNFAYFASTTALLTDAISPYTGNIKNLYINTDGARSTSATNEVVINDAVIGPSCSSTTSCHDTTTSTSVTAGDRIVINISPAGSTPVRTYGSFQIFPP